METVMFFQSGINPLPYAPFEMLKSEYTIIQMILSIIMKKQKDDLSKK